MHPTVPRQSLDEQLAAYSRDLSQILTRHSKIAGPAGSGIPNRYMLIHGMALNVCWLNPAEGGEGTREDE